MQWMSCAASFAKYSVKTMKSQCRQPQEETDMTLTSKDRKIKTQQNIINRLEEENRILKEQLETCDPENAIKRMEAAEELYQEYKANLAEVAGMREGYTALILELSEMKKEMREEMKRLERK